MRACLWLTWLWLAAPAMAGSENAALIQAEQRDAHLREKNELASRIADLQKQAATIESLADRQTQYIEQLQAQIDALQQPDATESQP